MREFNDGAEYKLFQQFRNPELDDLQVLQIYRQIQAFDAYRAFFEKILMDAKMAERDEE